MKHSHGLCLLAIALVLYGCGGPSLPAENRVSSLPEMPVIFPDYTHITIPANIAPLNFRIEEEGKSFVAVLEGEKGRILKVKSRKKVIRIPIKKWTRLLKENLGSELGVRVYKKEGRQWLAFDSFPIQVSDESIDPCLVYRLIPPGYETWSSMGLYERDLSSFAERPVIENRHIEDNCVNCHSFNQGNQEQMLFHVRGSLGGTMIKRDGVIEKVDMKREETLSAGVYPGWHPSGEYVTFSTNKIEQYFHASSDRTIEVLDRRSDLVLYHTGNQEITHVPGTKGERYMETYPCWSPDGRYLYFSRSEADANTPFDSIRYDICRMSFDPESEQFGAAELIFRASEQGKSASFPRISPDGKYLLITLHDYGTFPIWHKEADLCLIDLMSRRSELPEKANSSDTDSYHSWAQNSRWIVFSSRRYDGRYTKLYISYLDKEGQFQKAFLLPQRDPGMYDTFFYSYNRPELISSSIQTRSRQWVREIRAAMKSHD